MNTFTVRLDLAKGTITEPVRLRQGDKNGTTIVAEIYDHGQRLADTGLSAYVVIPNPDKEHYYRKSGTYTTGTVTVTINEAEAATVAGIVDNAYIELVRGSTLIATTQSFPVIIQPSAMDGAEPGETYDDAIQDAIDRLDDAIEAIPDTVEDVLEAHPEWTTTVQDGAVTDAKLYQGKGGILARNARLMHRLDNLLSAQLPEGDSATATDAAKTPLAGLSLYGRSTQDGTPTPSAPVAIESVEGQLYQQTMYAAGTTRTTAGVTVTYNEDGTCTVTGTATSHAWLWGGGSSSDARLYVTLPAGTYTICGSHSVIAQKMVEGVVSNLVSQTAGSATFTLTEETLVKAVPIIPNGTTVTDATVWVALYPGSTPMPYVPYGNAGLWARGRNWLDPSIARSGTQKNVTVAADADGWFTISGTSDATSAGVITMWGGTDSRAFPQGVYTLLLETEGTPFVASKVRFQVYGVKESGSATYVDGAGSYQLDYSENGIDRIGVYVANGSSGTTVNGRFRITLVGGTTAPTAYIPYTETVTPIDLDGHELRSLPDGTRDELTVGADGRVTLVQRVGALTFDGSESWQAASASGVFNLVLWTQSGGTLIPASQQSGLCDRLAWDNAGVASMADGTFKVGSSGTSEYAFIVNKSYTTATEIKAWLAENPTTITYKLPPEGYVTIDLGWTDAIPLCGPDLTAQAVPAAPFALTYERDLNVTLARLEAALAALA